MKKIILICFPLILASCASHVPLQDPNQKSPSILGDASTKNIEDPANIATVDSAKTSSKTNHNELAPQPKTIYFDTDSYSIKDEFKPIIIKHSDFSKQNNSSLLLQGHTDQRGTSEYNLALGQKRAEATKQALNILGVKAENIETVSFGKEKPAVDGNNEQAYSQNRRTEIVYK